MTISYAVDVSKADYLSLLRLMFRWKGSLWKNVYVELALWLILYSIIALLYHLGLHGENKRAFEKVVKYCYDFGDWIPLSFMLGAYVTLVVNRWWAVISHIGFIDNLALVVANYIRGKDDRTIMFKRNIVRYMCLLQAMVYRAISPPVKRKYPTLQSLCNAGYLEPNELRIFSEDNFYQSVSWAMALARIARDEGIIKSDQALQDIFKFCIDFRWSQITLWYYNWVPIPLAYTQVVFLTVRIYFLICIIGRQFIVDNESHWPVAEELLNPCGDDDADFDFESFLARNLKQALAIVDEDHCIPPPLCLSNHLLMTIHYSASVATAKYSRFAQVMFRWKGSLWKLIYIEVIVWLLFYAALSILYRVGLHGDSKILALVVTNYVRGKDDRSIMFKRNIIRHMTLVQAMVYRSISPPVMRKYPTLASLVEAGYLEPNEVERFSENNYYQSVSWALALAREARDEGIIKSDPALQDIFRVAEALINPCGDDDENFDFEEFLTRNMNVCLSILKNFPTKSL
uniref:Bestrophin homolog n=1 Tax=Ascaris lumbricoides TaxID=6252 RepID=A0A9J2PYV2_ASCLU